jgi:hypothetical protein
MADATLRFLKDPAFQLATRRRAYRYAKPMFWSNVGRLYLDFFDRSRLRQAHGERMDHRLAKQPPQRAARASRRLCWSTRNERLEARPALSKGVRGMR